MCSCLGDKLGQTVVHIPILSLAITTVQMEMRNKSTFIRLYHDGSSTENPRNLHQIKRHAF